MARGGTGRNRAHARGEGVKGRVDPQLRADAQLHVLPALGARKVADVCRADVQYLVDGLVAQDLAPVTVQCAILPLRAIYGLLVDRGDLAVNPTSKVNVPAVRRARDSIRIPSLDDAVKLLEALELRDRALYSTALYAGCG